MIDTPLMAIGIDLWIGFASAHQVRFQYLIDQSIKIGDVQNRFRFRIVLGRFFSTAITFWGLGGLLWLWKNVPAFESDLNALYFLLGFVLFFPCVYLTQTNSKNGQIPS